SLLLGQLPEWQLDFLLGSDSASLLANLTVVHRDAEVLSVALAEVRQVIGENEGGQLADAELADLLPSLRRWADAGAFVTLADQPMLPKPRSIHRISVVHDNDRGVISRPIGRHQDVHVRGPGV